MGNHKYLSKNEELEIGRLMQNGREAKKMLSTFPDLSHDEKLKLKKDIARGERALETLVKSNTGIVRKRAEHYKSAGLLEYDDLVQEGFIGLLVAANKYDPARSNKFSTVAYPWITQRMGRSINQTGRIVRLPENRINDYNAMNDVEVKYAESGLTRHEIDQKIIEETSLTMMDIYSIRNAFQKHASIDKEQEGANGVLDYVVGGKVPAAEDQYLNEEMNSVLLKYIAMLGEVSEDIICSKNEMPNSRNEFLKPIEVRRKYSLTNKEYESRIPNIINKLRQKMSDDGLSLKDFVG